MNPPPPPPPPAVHAAPFPAAATAAEWLLVDNEVPWRCGEGSTVTGKDGERPGEQVCDAWLDTEHFRVHYATAGDDVPPGYPDLTHVRHLGEYLEHAYRVETEAMGLPPPLPDGTRGGGIDLIDCYLYDLGEDGPGGRAHGEPADSTACPGGMTGYCEVTTLCWVQDFDRQLRLVSAHELFHLIQFAENAEAMRWLKESTARRVEAFVWPEIASRLGIWSWFNTPELALWHGGFRQYAPHFWIFLEAHLDAPDVVADVWRRCCGRDGLSALQDAIAARGSTFNDELTEFAVWNALTYDHDDGRHYPDGAHFPPIRLHGQHRGYPVLSAQVPDSLLPEVTGSDYVRFHGPATANTLRVTVAQDPQIAPWRRIACVATRGGVNAVWRAVPDSTGTAVLAVPDWGLYDAVTLVVTTVWDPAAYFAPAQFTYSAV